MANLLNEEEKVGWDQNHEEGGYWHAVPEADEDRSVAIDSPIAEVHSGFTRSK